jgi:hypothetical protein
LVSSLSRREKEKNAHLRVCDVSFQTKAGKSVIEALNLARTQADKGRPQPNTPAFDDLITKLGDINNWDIGAALRVQSYMFHTEGLTDLSKKLSPILHKKGFGLLTGFDYRNYIVVPDGNYFINPTNVIFKIVLEQTRYVISNFSAN